MNEERLKNLAIRLLDDEDGITEDAYAALLDILPESLALALNKEVKATEGRFYLPEGHSLQAWRVMTAGEAEEQLDRLEELAAEFDANAGGIEIGAEIQGICEELPHDLPEVNKRYDAIVDKYPWVFEQVGYGHHEQP